MRLAISTTCENNAHLNTDSSCCVSEVRIAGYVSHFQETKLPVCIHHSAAALDSFSSNAGPIHLL